MKNINFFAELRRHNVYKVAMAYAVVGDWLIVEIGVPLFLFPETANES